MTEIEIRAELAKRVEDLRIARKHREEAAARTSTAASIAAYQGACAWENICREREQAARAAVIAL